MFCNQITFLINYNEIRDCKKRIFMILPTDGFVGSNAITKAISTRSPRTFTWSTKFKSASSCRNYIALWHTDHNNPLSTWPTWYKLSVLRSWQLKHLLVLFSFRLTFNFTLLGKTLTLMSSLLRSPFFSNANLINTKSVWALLKSPENTQFIKHLSENPLCM